MPQPVQRLDPMSISPTLFKRFADFAMAIAREGTLEPGLIHLLDIRASQINGCAFCVDMHVKQAVLHNERPLRLHHVAIWRESPLFTDRERAALAWTEAVTTLGPHGIPDAVYDEARAHFDEKSLVDLTFQLMAINGWNRLNVALRGAPGSKDKAFGLDKAGLV